jgi:GNAT superfamily N-acetyltransferase
MSRAWHLRTATAMDRDLLLQIYASTRQDEMDVVDWSDEEKATFLFHQFTAQDLYYREEFPDCTFEIIVVEEEDAGRLYVDRRDDEIRIVDIALLPPVRGKGVGTELMQSILDEASTAELVVRIHVEEYNPAQSLYRRLGFRELENVGTYILMEWTTATNP